MDNGQKNWEAFECYSYYYTNPVLPWFLTTGVAVVSTVPGLKNNIKLIYPYTNNAR